jgi:tight adherence protein B
MQSQYVATYESSITQGSVDVEVSVGNLTSEASYVAGNAVQGGAVAEVVEESEGFGPDWLQGKLGGAVGLALVGLAVGLGAYALASLASSTDESLNAVLRPYSEGPISPTEDDGALAQTALLQRAVELTEEFAERQGFLVKVERALERADLPLRAAEALFFYGAGAILITLLALALGGFTTGLAVGVITLMVPPAAVNFLAGQRSKKFQAALPDTLNLLSGSLRAGYSLLQGIEAVSKEVADPMGQELRRVITEARLGREIEDAMDSVAERMGSADFAWAVMAIRIQREVGGNLSELLLTVADTMVHRERLRRDIAALTAEGKISAIILGLLPVGLGAFMWMSNPVYMAPLGSTTMGHVLLAISLVSLLIGFAWMKKIINIKI